MGMSIAGQQISVPTLKKLKSDVDSGMSIGDALKGVYTNTGDTLANAIDIWNSSPHPDYQYKNVDPTITNEAIKNTLDNYNADGSTKVSVPAKKTDTSQGNFFGMSWGAVIFVGLVMFMLWSSNPAEPGKNIGSRRTAALE